MKTSNPTSCGARKASAHSESWRRFFFIPGVVRTSSEAGATAPSGVGLPSTVVAMTSLR